MPSNLKRYYGSGDLHFVTTSCYRRQPFLGTRHGRDLFLNVLERMRRRYRFVVLGYVVMPEHVHLLLSEPQRDSLSTVLQALKLGYSRRILTGGCTPQPRGLGHARQHLWQARFTISMCGPSVSGSRTALHAPQSREARSGGIAGAMGVEQFPLLPVRRGGAGSNQRYRYIGDASSPAGGLRIFGSTVATVQIPGLAKTARPGAPCETWGTPTLTPICTLFGLLELNGVDGNGPPPPRCYD